MKSNLPHFMQGPQRTAPAVHTQSRTAQPYAPLLRMFDALVDDKQPLTGREAEESQEAARGADMLEMSLPGGRWVPWSWLAARRDLQVSTGVNAGTTAGGLLVGTNVSRLEQTIAPLSVVARAGIDVREDLVGNVTIPLMDVPPARTWLTFETTPAGDATPMTGQLSLSPKMVMTRFDVSRNLRRDALDFDGALREILSVAMATTIDDAILSGTGLLGQPRGIRNTPQVVTAIGSPLTWANVSNAMEDVCPWSEYGTWVCGSNARNSLMLNAGPGHPLWTDEAVLGRPAFVSSYGLPPNSMVYGDFRNAVLGTWGNGVQIAIDPYTHFRDGRVTFSAMLAMDVGVKRPWGFVKFDGVSNA
jgi:HK97 family phage major capsid protein